MSTVEPALYAKLAAAGDVAALCATRIYPVVAPQEAPAPLVVYRVVEQRPHGNVGGVPDCWVTRFELAAEADTYAEAAELADALRAATDRQTGTWGTVPVVGAWCPAGKEDLYDETARRHVCLLELLTTHQEV